MRRICKQCRRGFEVEYRRGRPKDYCSVCQPPGTRMIGATKVMNENSPDLRREYVERLSDLYEGE